jgi:hypothetical protein
MSRAFVPLLEISFLAKFTHPEEEKTIPRYVYCLTFSIIVFLYLISGPFSLLFLEKSNTLVFFCIYRHFPISSKII